jgi:hypothetical protein
MQLPEWGRLPAHPTYTAGGRQSGRKKGLKVLTRPRLDSLRDLAEKAGPRLSTGRRHDKGPESLRRPPRRNDALRSARVQRSSVSMQSFERPQGRMRLASLRRRKGSANRGRVDRQRARHVCSAVFLPRHQGRCHEAHLPAQQSQARPHPRFPCTYGDCRWTQGPLGASRQGSQAPLPVSAEASPDSVVHAAAHTGCSVGHCSTCLSVLAGLASAGPVAFTARHIA